MTALITIAVCDDETYMLELLAQKIRSFFKSQNTGIRLLCFEDGASLLAANEDPDIIFLDIQMKAPNGLETAKKLRDRGFNGFLIFVTVMRDEVFHAFEVQAFDYLIKPLDGDNFAHTMNRLVKSLRERRLENLLVQKGNDWTLVPFEAILYCESMDRKVYLHLKDSAVLDYYDRIEMLEQKLDSRFYRCHRSYLVNLQHLTGWRAGLASLTGGVHIPVSRLRKDGFTEAVLRYMSTGRYGK